MCRNSVGQRWTTISLPYRPDRRPASWPLPGGMERGITCIFAIALDGQFAGHLDLRVVEGPWADVGYAAAPWARRQG